MLILFSDNVYSYKNNYSRRGGFFLGNRTAAAAADIYFINLKRISRGWGADPDDDDDDDNNNINS